MKRLFSTCLVLLVLVACERYPGEQVDAPREQPGNSIQEYQESTADDQLLDNPIPGTDTTPQEGVAATGPSTAGAADPVDPGVDTTVDVADTPTDDTPATDTVTGNLPPVEAPDVGNVSPDPVNPGPVDAATDLGILGTETGGTETGATQVGGTETENAATGGVTVENVGTGNAETGGADTGSADTGGPEAGGADEAADLELIGRTTNFEDADAAQAVATIEAWQARLEGLNNPDFEALSADLATLKTELQASSPDENRVKTLLYTLGQETSRLALAAPQDVGDALNALGTTLSEAGEESAVATAPVDVGGAMPGGAETGGAAVGGAEAETGGSTPGETGGADMNLQTGTVERDDSGVSDASLAETTETGGAQTTAQNIQPAETGGAETGGVSAAETRENVASSQAPEVTEGELLASATLQDAEGNEVGVVNLVSSNTGLVFQFGLAEGATLEAGEHGFHVHETGACEPTFEAAGDHLNPSGAQHGLLNANGPHAGDLPNLLIPEDGSPTYVVTTTLLSEADLFDADGSAVIIHSGPDDYVTDPGGNSGDRTACGVLERVSASQ